MGEERTYARVVKMSEQELNESMGVKEISLDMEEEFTSGSKPIQRNNGEKVLFFPLANIMEGKKPLSIEPRGSAIEKLASCQLKQ